MPLSSEDIRALIAFGREQSGVEFKSAGDRSDPALRGRVIRGMLAMANRRDGGTVIVGVREEPTGLRLDGLDAMQITSWKHDSLSDTVAEYADPRIGFDSYPIAVDGHALLVIEVREFSEVPVICKRTMQEGKTLVLRDGAMYVRSNRKPESREVASYDEMRELLDIATDKGVRAFVSRARGAGLDVTFAPGPDNAAAFRAERGDL
jgi:predicted HTH transcriptional regulator